MKFDDWFRAQFGELPLQDEGDYEQLRQEIFAATRQLEQLKYQKERQDVLAAEYRAALYAWTMSEADKQKDKP